MQIKPDFMYTYNQAHNLIKSDFDLALILIVRIKLFKAHYLIVSFFLAFVKNLIDG